MFVPGTVATRVAMSLLALLLCNCTREKRKTNAVTPPPSQSPSPAADSTAPTGCLQFQPGKKLGRIANTALKEASGLVASRKNPKVLWSHNDSGSGPRLFALGEDGTDLGTYHLAKVKPEDWEDLAIGPAERAGEFYLYIGDIGTNTQERHRVSVYRVPEPSVELTQTAEKRKLTDVERFDFTYPDERVHDAETLMIDPRGGDVYVATKPRNDTPRLYRARAPLVASNSQVLEEVAKLTVFEQGTRRSTLVTAGDISADGSQILIRTYTTAFLWTRLPDESVDEAFTREPCPMPLSREPQGETIAFTPSGMGYYTVSEGQEPKILFFARSP